MNVIYVETAVKQHPRVQALLARFGANKTVIDCDHYREVFNRKGQNFRIQKQNPALILASKPGRTVLPTPEGFGIGGAHNYYFSTMLNCPFDCRYCYLQGMYQSAHHVVFVNYEDFMQGIVAVLDQHPGERVYFFSGYDSDSLALDPITGFLQDFLPFFSKHPRAILELRTKSTNVRALLHQKAIDNVVVAFSLTPDAISSRVENKVPSVARRLEVMKTLAARGWSLGLRLDPLIYADNFQQLYSELIDSIFAVISPDMIHSVSLGLMRFPEKMYQKLTRLYPQDKLMAHPLQKRGTLYSYDEQREVLMTNTIRQQLRQYVPDALLFECVAS